MSDITDEQLADRFGCSTQYVQQKCRTQQWPHYRIARTYWFTPEDVEQIKTTSRPAPKADAPADTWGQKTR